MLQRARSFMVRQKKPVIEEEPDLSETAHLRRPKMPKFLEHRHTFQPELYDIPKMDRRNPLRLRENHGDQSARRQSISLDDMMRVTHFSSKELTENKSPKNAYKSGEIRDGMHRISLFCQNSDEDLPKITECKMPNLKND